MACEFDHAVSAMTADSAGSDGRLPGGASLAPGEVILATGRFMFSTVAFYLMTDLVLTNRRLYAMRPSTFLGLIPIGTKRSNFPIENIAEVNAATRFNIAGVITGALALLIGLAALSLHGAEFFGIILILLGGYAIVGAPKQAIEVMNSGGGLILFPVSVLERKRTLEFAGDVSEAMARPSFGGRTPPPQAQSPEPVDARGALRNLEQLRSEGLITADEYAAKRAEILQRL
jgi:hypothetical protein